VTRGAERDPTESALAVDAGAATAATEAFALLGNETRLAVLLALWESYDPHAEENAVPFSRIFERVDYDDPGNLSYHLGKLEGQFVRQRAKGEGYELRIPGLKLVQAVVAGAGTGDARREQVEIDEPCPFCDAPTTVGYQEGVVVRACTACEGAAPERTETEGFLSAVKFERAGLADRDAAELRAASSVATLRQVRSMFDGLCPTCSGAVEGWLDRCPDHEGGVCDACGSRFPVRARFECRVCKDHSICSPKALALFHPAVVSLYDDHGISTRVRADDPEGAAHLQDLYDDHGLELVSEDPPKAAVTASCGGNEVRLVLDETVRVVNVLR